MTPDEQLAPPDLSHYPVEAGDLLKWYDGSIWYVQYIEWACRYPGNPDTFYFVCIGEDGVDVLFPADVYLYAKATTEQQRLMHRLMVP